MEQSHIAVKRAEFLRLYQNYKDEGLYKFVFIDETWIFQNGSICRSWQDDNKRSVRSIKTDGKRYIILHAGNENGFIEGAEAKFSSKSTLLDYHGEMNQENFLLWFENQLPKSWSEPSLIIMDNAPYHSMLLEKAPNTSSTKSDIKVWLTNKNLPFNDTMLRNKLLQIVAQNKPPPKYIVDDLAEQYGHKILRLPPYHCIWNAIELIWGTAKTYYNKHVGRDGYKECDALKMWKEALQTITPQKWQNCIRHTENIIKQWYDRERIIDRQEILPIIINLDGDSDSSSDMDSD
ncbi:uncharacterized protein LOC114327584 [Diabrotica virgifera virgifera]|uniref:Tc1-like transposase DDE domain-containing protein n=1 Tax=Diabrotica virgifera virgifera TaxID=50390 RepID=A0ABM5IG77_DIAVI|nr:uncharacterized protein LOC114327584 [Diabrotica virgifera virgifera]